LNSLPAPAVAADPIDAAAPDTQHFLVFLLDGEQFCVDIRAVRECVHYRTLAAFMDGAVRVPGVALWRGIILPWIDLRAPYAQARAPTDILVLTLRGALIALAVDAATDVIALGPEQIVARPRAGGLVGVSEHQGRRLHMLDIDALFTNHASPLARQAERSAA